MSKGTRYKIVTPTLGILSEAGNRSSVTIPSGAVIELASDRINGDRMVDVLWEGKALLMFVQDLEGRGEPIPA